MDDISYDNNSSFIIHNVFVRAHRIYIRPLVPHTKSMCLTKFLVLCVLDSVGGGVEVM